MDEHERSTPTTRRLLAAVTFLLLSGPLSTHANIIYTWTGTCVTTCVGQATMLVVTTDAYIPGEPFEPNFPVPEPPRVLLRALYADSNLAFDWAEFFYNARGEFYLWPDMPPNTSGAFFGFILSGENQFRSTAQGDWRSEGASAPPGGGLGCPPPVTPGFCAYDARGINGVWTRLQTSVPAPSTLVLLGVGLVGLVFRRRRSR